MAGSEEGRDRRWLVEPVGANDVRVHVETGEGTEISEEARAALDALLDELQTSEVEGFAYRCPELKACGQFYCLPLGKCSLIKTPCFADVTCGIARFA